MVEIKGTLFTGVYDNKTDKVIELPSFEHFENALYKMSEKPRDKKEDSELMGQPTDPKRFSDSDLLERELSYGRSGFSLQFMLDTSLSDANRYPL